MQEYWVNVYEGGIKSAAIFSTRNSAIKSSILITYKCIYRIHVKMKDKPRLAVSKFEIHESWKWL